VRLKKSRRARSAFSPACLGAHVKGELMKDALQAARELAKEQNNFALIPKPSSAVEKVAPGAKRVLSGMVADTLVLAKRERPSKSIFTVLTGRCLGELFEAIIKQKLDQQYDLRFLRFGDEGGFYCDEKGLHAAELCNLARDRPFDLIVVYGPMLTKDIELLAYLKNHHGKPIVATSGRADNEMAEQMKSIGIAFLPAPFSVEEFWRVLQSCLNISKNASELIIK
jgi:hypothetical protein